MANNGEIDLIASDIAFEQVDKLTKLIEKADLAMIKLANDALLVNKNTVNIVSPKGLNDQIISNKKLADEYFRQEALIQKLQIQIIKIEQAKRKETTTIAQTMKALENETKARQSLEKQRDKTIAQNDKEATKLNASLNLYNKVQAKLSALQNEYKALATQKELSGRLSDSEAKRYDFLSARIQKYDGTLKAVDASMGKYQRNVGNYASAFNPVSNSINQLTREMPAFAVSVQTGFLAISNNLPIFFDAMQQAIGQQKELQKQGLPSKNALEIFAGGFLTLGSALSIGITLLTIYGKDIVEFIGKTIKGTQSIDGMAEAQTKLNDVRKEGLKSAQEELITLKANLEIAKDVNLSYKERNIAVEALQDQYPAYLGNLSKEQILAGNTAVAENALTNAIVARAKATAAVAKITENQGKVIDIEMQRLELRKEAAILKTIIDSTQKELENSDNVSSSQGIALSQLAQEYISLISKINTLSGEKYELDKVSKTLTDFTIKQKKASILLDYKEEKIIKDKTKAKAKAKEKDVKITEQYQKNSKKAIEANIAALQNELDGIDRTSDAYGLIQGQLNLLKTIYKQLFSEISQGQEEISQGQEEVIEGIELTDEAVYSDYYAWLKLKEATDQYIDSISSGVLENSLNSIGLASVRMFLDFDKNGQSTFDKLIEGATSLKEKFAITFKAVGDVAIETFALLNNASKENFQIERDNLATQRDIAISYSNESSEAKKEIDRQYERSQREIRVREAKSAKKLALFNIGINTAQGVISALASTPPNVPLSIAIGVIGLLQAGIVSGKQIPAYFQGTQNHKGGAMLVNDGFGADYKETIVTPDGKIMQPTERNVVMDAPKGTKVFTHKQWKDKLEQSLFSQGIVLNQSQQSSGIQKADIDRLVSTIKNKNEYKPVFDKKGFRTYITNGQKEIEILNNRVSGIGKDV
jgi:hypothetical protein